MKAEAGDQPSILVAQTAFLGDVVLTTPLLLALRAKFPAAFIAFLGTPGGCEALSGLAEVDCFISYDKKGKEKGLGSFFRKAEEIKSYHFQLALSAHRSARTSLLLARAAIPRRIGFQTAALSFLYHERVPRPPHQHEVMRNLALLGPLSGSPPGFEPRLSLGPLPPEKPPLVRGGGEGPAIGLCPGSVWKTKRWPAAGFQQVAQMLRRRWGATVYLLGAEDDGEVAREVAASGEGVVNLAGRTGLQEWIRCMAAMDLVITNDSAPTHVACALGVPVVVIFGPTTPSQGFAPWGTRSRVLEVPDLACRPCGEHGGRKCPEGHFQCMERISPEEVVRAAESLLRGG